MNLHLLTVEHSMLPLAMSDGQGVAIFFVCIVVLIGMFVLPFAAIGFGLLIWGASQMDGGSKAFGVVLFVLALVAFGAEFLRSNTHPPSSGSL